MLGGWRPQIPSSELSEQLAPLVNMETLLNQQIDEQDEQIEQRVDAEPDAQRLQSMHGVGPLRALLLFLAVLDRAARVDNAHSVMSYM